MSCLSPCNSDYKHTYNHCTAEYAENITVKVTMTKRLSSKQEGCLTASKVYQAQVQYWCSLLSIMKVKSEMVSTSTPSITLHIHRGTHLMNQWHLHPKTLKEILSGFAIMILRWAAFKERFRYDMACNTLCWWLWTCHWCCMYKM